MTEEMFEAEPAEEPTSEETEESWDSVDEFIGDSESFELPDPERVVTIRTSSGGDKYVPVTEPTSVDDILAQSGLAFAGAVNFYLNGAEVSRTTLIPGGSTLTVIGSVKGG